jgi:hypothetical protein
MSVDDALSGEGHRLIARTEARAIENCSCHRLRS